VLHRRRSLFRLRLLTQLARAVRDPARAWSVGLSLLKGWWYKLTYPARGIRFSAGRGFRVTGRLIVRGPGRVRFGDHVRVGMTVTPWTHTSEAVIDVGDETFLNGTRFGCARSITVGRRCILADISILDTDFHSTQANRHDPTAPVRVSPVAFADNVWVASGAGVLPGARIGENSVVGFGAVVSGTFPANVIIVGNPASILRPIPESPPS
jgi:acetyltransferase-like isoleucine patch superfamily enzyme